MLRQRHRRDTARPPDVAGSVQENAPAGTVVATLGAVDPDAGESLHLYAGRIRPACSSGRQQVRLKAGATLDYEAAASHELTVTVTDAAGVEPHRDAHDRRHQPERGADRHHGGGRHGAGECRRRHGGGHAGRGGPGCGREFHLYAGQ